MIDIDILFFQESQLNYTVGRLVQGLASTRESARHGYFVTLVGILKSFPSENLPDKVFHDAVSNKLVIEGSKKVYAHRNKSVSTHLNI